MTFIITALLNKIIEIRKVIYLWTKKYHALLIKYNRSWRIIRYRKLLNKINAIFQHKKNMHRIVLSSLMIKMMLPGIKIKMCMLEGGPHIKYPRKFKRDCHSIVKVKKAHLLTCQPTAIWSQFEELSLLSLEAKKQFLN